MKIMIIPIEKAKEELEKVKNSESMQQQYNMRFTSLYEFEISA